MEDNGNFDPEAVRLRLLMQRHLLWRSLDQYAERAAELETDEVQDWIDRAQHFQDEALLHHFGETERAELMEIRDALNRLEAGTYGVCERCGAAIGRRRLEAKPYARRCIVCQSLEERERGRAAAEPLR